jgi:UDP-2-acetamido-3-amino-2,3-dideoxy-glucuronate N-acetyltransferase
MSNVSAPLDPVGKIWTDPRLERTGPPSIADPRTLAWSIIDLQTVKQPRGSLSVAEIGKSLPFPVRRTFFVYDVPTGEKRGAHAHRRCHQLLICVAGSVRALAISQGCESHFVLQSPDTGLLLTAGTWGGQYDYSSDAVLCVLASEPYDQDDYIHDFDEFRGYEGRITRQRNQGLGT